MKYKQLGSLFNRLFRNDLNENFNQVDKDIRAQKARVDALINQAPQPDELVDIRTDADGVTYEVANNRLLADQQKINKKVDDFSAETNQNISKLNTDLETTNAQLAETETKQTEIKNKQKYIDSSVKTRRNMVHLISHRGRFEAPEQTVMALTSMPTQVKGVEIDVRFTSDGEPILMHDDTVDRTTNGTGTVDSFTLAGITALDAGVKFSAWTAGAKVPTLSGYLKVCRELNMTLVCLDIKVLSTQTQVEKIKNAILDANMEDRCILLFNAPWMMELWRTHDLEMRVGLLNATTDNIGTYITYSNDYGGELIFIAAGESNYNTHKAIISNIHEAGILAGGSVLNAPEVVIKAVKQDGLDVIMSDRTNSFTHIVEVRS